VIDSVFSEPFRRRRALRGLDPVEFSLCCISSRREALSLSARSTTSRAPARVDGVPVLLLDEASARPRRPRSLAAVVAEAGGALRIVTSIDDESELRLPRIESASEIRVDERLAGGDRRTRSAACSTRRAGGGAAALDARTIAAADRASAACPATWACLPARSSERPPGPSQVQPGARARRRPPPSCPAPPASRERKEAPAAPGNARRLISHLGLGPHPSPSFALAWLAPLRAVAGAVADPLPACG
jgi:hypothetical protein